MKKFKKSIFFFLASLLLIGLSPFWGDLISYWYVDRSSWVGDAVSYMGAEETGQTITDAWFQTKRTAFAWSYGAMIALGGLAVFTMRIWWKWFRWSGFIGMGIVAVGLIILWLNFSIVYTPIENLYEQFLHPGIQYFFPLF